MQWLQDSTQMRNCTCIDEVVTTLVIHVNQHHLIIRAEITPDKCVITELKKVAKV